MFIDSCFSICLKKQREVEKLAELVNQTHKLTPGRKLDLSPLVWSHITFCVDIYMQQDKELKGDVAGRGKAGSSLVPDWVWGLAKAA